MLSLQTLHENFLREKRLADNLTPKALQWHSYAFRYFERAIPLSTPAALTKDDLINFIEALRMRGWRTVSINTRCRSLNVFFRWLHAEGHLTNSLCFKKLKEEKTVIPTLSEMEQKRLVAFRPTGFGFARAHTLALTLLDSGLRIDEALGLRKTDLSYDEERVPHCSVLCDTECGGICDGVLLTAVLDTPPR